MVGAFHAIFRHNQHTERSLRVSNSNSSDSIENLERIIFNLALSRYNANFSKLVLKNFNL